MTKLTLILTLLTLSVFANEPISPLPEKVSYDKTKALLGKSLFEDTILSKDYSTACVSCHNIYAGGADEREVSLGFDGREGNIQSPSVFNARYNFKQFWNGRADDLYAQADGPLHNPAEHNMDKETILKRLSISDRYKKQFFAIYQTKTIAYSQVLDVIVEFENALVTPNSKFDKYLRGELLLEADEKEGYSLFKGYGCITCHNGINIGGNSFQKMGTFIEYHTTKEYPDRSKIVQNEAFRNVFKVPTLRNITLTPPYFHDASAKTLHDAVKTMSHHNLGIEMRNEDVDKIVSFLKTLKGEKPEILSR